jgi:hypothetical protein
VDIAVFLTTRHISRDYSLLKENMCKWSQCQDSGWWRQQAGQILLNCRCYCWAELYSCTSKYGVTKQENCVLGCDELSGSLIGDGLLYLLSDHQRLRNDHLTKSSPVIGLWTH